MEKFDYNGVEVCNECTYLEYAEDDEVVYVERIEQCGECFFEEALWSHTEDAVKLMWAEEGENNG